MIQYLVEDQAQPQRSELLCHSAKLASTHWPPILVSEVRDSERLSSIERVKRRSLMLL